jgi:hypothetical protein
MDGARSAGVTCILVVAVVVGGSCTGERAPGESDRWDDKVRIKQFDRTTWRQVESIKLSSAPHVTVGGRGGQEEEVLFRVAGGGVMSDGRVVVLNAGANELRLYERDGTLSWRQGREGQGPGEYVEPEALFMLPGDSLVVWDARLARVTVVAPDGDVVRVVTLPGRPSATEVVGVLSDGSLVVFRQRFAEEIGRGSQQYYGHYSKYSASGDSLGALGVFPWRRLVTLTPSSEGDMKAVSAGPPVFDSPTRVAATASGLWVGTTKKSELIWLNRSGERERVVRWVGGDRAVTDAVKQAYFDDLEDRLGREISGSAIEDRPFADSLPSHGQLVSRTDGGIWMEEFVPPGTDAGNPWRVFDASGELEGRVRLPPSAEVLWASGAEVLLLEQDELGVEFVRLYEIVS